MADDSNTPMPPKNAGEPADFTPEAAEFEPAGGIVKKPPTPIREDAAGDDGAG